MPTPEAGPEPERGDRAFRSRCPIDNTGVCVCVCVCVCVAAGGFTCDVDARRCRSRVRVRHGCSTHTRTHGAVPRDKALAAAPPGCCATAQSMSKPRQWWPAEMLLYAPLSLSWLQDLCGRAGGPASCACQSRAITRRVAWSALAKRRASEHSVILHARFHLVQDLIFQAGRPHAAPFQWLDPGSHKTLGKVVWRNAYRLPCSESLYAHHDGRHTPHQLRVRASALLLLPGPLAPLAQLQHAPGQIGKLFRFLCS